MKRRKPNDNPKQDQVPSWIDRCWLVVLAVLLLLLLNCGMAWFYAVIKLVLSNNSFAAGLFVGFYLGWTIRERWQDTNTTTVEVNEAVAPPPPAPVAPPPQPIDVSLSNRHDLTQGYGNDFELLGARHKPPSPVYARAVRKWQDREEDLWWARQVRAAKQGRLHQAPLQARRARTQEEVPKWETPEGLSRRIARALPPWTSRSFAIAFEQSKLG